MGGSWKNFEEITSESLGGFEGSVNKIQIAFEKATRVGLKKYGKSGYGNWRIGNLFNVVA